MFFIVQVSTILIKCFFLSLVHWNNKSKFGGFLYFFLPCQNNQIFIKSMKKYNYSRMINKLCISKPVKHLWCNVRRKWFTAFSMIITFMTKTMSHTTSPVLSEVITSFSKPPSLILPTKSCKGLGPIVVHLFSIMVHLVLMIKNFFS